MCYNSSAWHDCYLLLTLVEVLHYQYTPMWHPEHWKSHDPNRWCHNLIFRGWEIMCFKVITVHKAGYDTVFYHIGILHSKQGNKCTYTSIFFNLNVTRWCQGINQDLGRMIVNVCYLYILKYFSLIKFRIMKDHIRYKYYDKV